MATKYVNDMTHGNETSLLMKFSLPLLAGNIFQQFYTMVDSIVVGKYVGAGALAAVGAVGSIVFLFFSMCFGMAGGVGILIAHHFGAGHKEEVKKTIANSVYIMAVGGIVMGIAGMLLAEPALRLMQTPESIIADSINYMRIVCAGTIAVAMYNGISSVLRALGDAKTPFIFLVVASIINIVLDIVFVYALGMGVAGVAYATIIAQVLSAAGSILVAMKKNEYFALNQEHFRPDPVIIRQCLKIGLPVGLQNSLISISCIVLQGFVNGYGEAAVAAFTATARVEQLVQQPFNSLCMAMSTFTGQNLGARKIDRVKRGLLSSLGITAGFSLVMVGVMYTGGPAIIRLFVNDAEVIALGTAGLKITSVFYFALGLIYITRGVLNGAGDALFAMITGLIEVAGRIGFASLFFLLPAFGIEGVWYATGLTWVVTAVGGVIRYRQGKWKRVGEPDPELCAVPVHEG